MALQPLLDDTVRVNDTLHVTFRCPASGIAIAVTADLAPHHDEDGDAELAGAVARAAVCTAFESVAGRFVWDPVGEQILSRAGERVLPSALARMIAEHPLGAEQRPELARIFGWILNAGGRTPKPEERDRALGYLGDVELDLDATAGPPDPAAFPGRTGHTAFMLACELAWTSTHGLTPPQAKALALLSQRLGVGTSAALRLERFARMHLLEQAATAWCLNGQQDPERLEAYAAGLGLSEEHRRKVLARCAARLGLSAERDDRVTQERHAAFREARVRRPRVTTAGGAPAVFGG